MLNPPHHPNTQTLSDYASGRLDERQCDEIDDHLAHCDNCCDRLDRLGNGHVEELLQQLPHETPFPSFETRPLAAAGGSLDDIPCGEARYELQAELGAGGMGVVFEAWDRQLKRRVAIKTLQPENALPGLSDRFVREALITGRLDHPGVPAAHELGTLSDGRPFMALRLVRGRNLATLLAEHRVALAGGAADTTSLLSVFGRLCDCVAYAHAQGIIHRDIKPANVMVGEFGEVQLMDWGLARRVEEAGPRDEGSGDSDSLAGSSAGKEHSTNDVSTNDVSTNDVSADDVSADDVSTNDLSATALQPTLAGTVLGTLGYMAPEQARGEQYRTGPGSDVFSLGAVLCEILTGRPAFHGHDRDQLVAVTRAADLSELRRRLAGCTADETLVMLMLSCLQPDPTQRPADAQVVAGQFSAWQAGVAQQLEDARLAQARSETQVQEERKRRRIQLALLVGCAVFAITVWRLVDRNQQQQAQFVAEERQRQSAETATATADLNSFYAALNKAVHSSQQDDPLWKEADFYLARAETAGRSLADSSLEENIATARTQQRQQRKQTDADWELLQGLEQMASNSRVGHLAGGRGELQFVDGIGPDNEARPLSNQPVPRRRAAGDGTQRSGPLRGARNGRHVPASGGPGAGGAAGGAGAGGRGAGRPGMGLMNSRISADRAERAVSAFARYGLDVAVVTASEATQKIQDRPPAFQQALLPHLQIWFHYAVEGNHDVSPWLQDLLCQLDDDPARNSLRQAMAARDVETLLIEATNPAFPQQPPELVWSVAAQIHHRAPRVSSELLSLAHLNHLNSTIIMWDLSRDMQMAGRRSEALLMLLARAAQETDPVQRAKALINIGHHYQRSGDIRSLVMVLRQAIELDPGQFSEASFVRDLGQIGNLAFETQTLSEMLDGGSLTKPESWLRLGDLYLDQQRWQDARDAFQHAQAAIERASVEQTQGEQPVDAGAARDLPVGEAASAAPPGAAAAERTAGLTAEIAERLAMCDLMLNGD